MVSAIRAQLPTPWQYNLKNYKSQDLLDRKFEIYAESRQVDQPVWGTERFILSCSLRINTDIYGWLRRRLFVFRQEQGIGQDQDAATRIGTEFQTEFAAGIRQVHQPAAAVGIECEGFGFPAMTLSSLIPR